MTDQFDPAMDTHYRSGGVTITKALGEPQAAFAKRVQAHRTKVKEREELIERQRSLQTQEQKERGEFLARERAWHREQARLLRWAKMNIAERVDRAIDRLAGLGLIENDEGDKIAPRMALTAALKRGEVEYTAALESFFSRAGFRPDGDTGGGVVFID